MPNLTLVQGTAARLPLADGSINTILTSPPYYGLRLYEGLAPEPWPGGRFAQVPGVPPTVIPGPVTWEALAACPHAWGEEAMGTTAGGGHHGLATRRDAYDAATGRRAVHPEARHSTDKLEGQGGQALSRGVWCTHCSCWCGCLGSEPTVELYLWHMVLVLRELWRVLREDGTLWLNLGDSYCSGNRQGHGTHVGDMQQTNRGVNGLADPARAPQPEGLAPGNLLGLPWRVALAAQAEGWVLRRDVVWQKVCPMPESVSGWRFTEQRCPCVTARSAPATQGSAQQNAHASHDHSGDIRNKLDGYGHPWPACPTCHGTGRRPDVALRRGSWRHTASHEFLFMLTKGMSYFANAEAVREPAADWGPRDRSTAKHNGEDFRSAGQPPHQGLTDGDFSARGRNPRDVLHVPPNATEELAAWILWLTTHAPDVFAAYQADRQFHAALPRDVVTPVPSNFPGAHFATFPPSLLEPLLRATCPERVCTACSAPWAPVTSPTSTVDPSANGSRFDQGKSAHHGHVQPGERFLTATHGLAPTCACPPDTPHRPGRVLDPFVGSGTTLLVARALGRDSLGVEASPAYLQLARARLGLTARAVWDGAPAAPGVESYNDLPLFQ